MNHFMFWLNYSQTWSILIWGEKWRITFLFGSYFHHSTFWIKLSNTIDTHSRKELEDYFPLISCFTIIPCSKLNYFQTWSIFIQGQNWKISFLLIQVFNQSMVLNKTVKNDLYSFKERIGGFCSFDFMFPIIPCFK